MNDQDIKTSSTDLSGLFENHQRVRDLLTAIQKGTVSVVANTMQPSSSQEQNMAQGNFTMPNSRKRSNPDQYATDSLYGSKTSTDSLYGSKTSADSLYGSMTPVDSLYGSTNSGASTFGSSSGFYDASMESSGGYSGGQDYHESKSELGRSTVGVSYYSDGTFQEGYSDVGDQEYQKSQGYHDYSGSSQGAWNQGYDNNTWGGGQAEVGQSYEGSARGSKMISGGGRGTGSRGRGRGEGSRGRGRGEGSRGRGRGEGSRGRGRGEGSRGRGRGEGWRGLGRGEVSRGRGRGRGSQDQDNVMLGQGYGNRGQGSESKARGRGMRGRGFDGGSIQGRGSAIKGMPRGGGHGNGPAAKKPRWQNEQQGYGETGSDEQRWGADQGWTRGNKGRGGEQRGRGKGSRGGKGRGGSSQQNNPPPLVQYDSNDIVYGFDGKLKGPERYSQTYKEYKYCKVCNVRINSMSAAQDHYNGKPHLKKLNNLLQEEEIKKKLAVNKFPEKCEVCNVKYTSCPQMKMHLDGAKHKRNLEALTGVPPEAKKEKNGESNQKSIPEKDKKKKLYITNIAPDANETSLQELLGCVSVRVPLQKDTDEVKNKGIAIAVFENQASAQSAIDEFEGKDGMHLEFTKERQEVKKKLAVNKFPEKCEVCHVQYTSCPQMKMHLDGGKHKRNLEALTGAPPEAEKEKNGESNQKSIPEKDEKKRLYITNIAPDANETSLQELLGCISVRVPLQKDTDEVKNKGIAIAVFENQALAQSAIDEFEGKDGMHLEFTKKREDKKARKPVVKDTGETSREPRNQNSVKENSQGASNKPSAVWNNKDIRKEDVSGGMHKKLFHCDLCNISCTSPETLAMHFEGKKHKRVMELSEKKLNYPHTSEKYQCELCHITAKDLYNLNQHYAGKKHILKLKQMKSGAIQPTVSKVPIQQQPQSSGPSSHHQETELVEREQPVQGGHMDISAAIAQSLQETTADMPSLNF